MSLERPWGVPDLAKKRSVESQYRVIDTEENSSHKKSRFLPGNEKGID